MKRFVIAVAALLLPASAFALAVPELHGRVNDAASLLTAGQASALEAKIAAFEKSTGHQFAFLSVSTLEGQSIEEFAVQTAHAWKLGDAKRDDGLLFVVSRGDRKIRIEVGYGLEGVIPDAVASRVIREKIGPLFKRGEWAAGVDAGFDALMAAAAPPPAAEPAPKPKPDGGLGYLWALMAGSIASIFAMVVVMVRRQRRQDALAQARRDALDREQAVWLRQQRQDVLEQSSRDAVDREQVERLRQQRERRAESPVISPKTGAATGLVSGYRPARKAEKPTVPASASSSDYSSPSSSSSSSLFDSDSSSSSSSDSFSGGGGDFGGGGASGDF